MCIGNVIDVALCCAPEGEVLDRCGHTSHSVRTENPN